MQDRSLRQINQQLLVKNQVLNKFNVTDEILKKNNLIGKTCKQIDAYSKTNDRLWLRDNYFPCAFRNKLGDALKRIVNANKNIVAREVGLIRPYKTNFILEYMFTGMKGDVDHVIYKHADIG